MISKVLKTNLGEVDDVGGQSSTNIAMSGCWVMEESDLQGDQALCA